MQGRSLIDRACLSRRRAGLRCERSTLLFSSGGHCFVGRRRVAPNRRPRSGSSSTGSRIREVIAAPISSSPTRDLPSSRASHSTWSSLTAAGRSCADWRSTWRRVRPAKTIVKVFDIPKPRAAHRQHSRQRCHPLPRQERRHRRVRRSAVHLVEACGFVVEIGHNERNAAAADPLDRRPCHRVGLADSIGRRTQSAGAHVKGGIEVVLGQSLSQPQAVLAPEMASQPADPSTIAALPPQETAEPEPAVTATEPPPTPVTEILPPDQTEPVPPPPRKPVIRQPPKPRRAPAAAASNCLCADPSTKPARRSAAGRDRGVAIPGGAIGGGAPRCPQLSRDRISTRITGP